MSSLVYFKFKANVKTDSIPFDGSSISVKDLKNAIRTKCCLYSSDFDLKLEDSSGKSYTKDEELIPKYTSIVVRRVPKLTSDMPKKRPTNPADAAWRDGMKNVHSVDSNAQKNLNLADSDLPEEEKIKIMMERSAEAFSEKHYAVKPKPYGVPPAAYICHKCGLPGHWIHNCPGVRDKTGKIMDVKSIKRPTGIPQDFLLEVDAGTPGAYLGKSGKYMVPIKDAEAYAQGKKDKRPFSVEENPPYVPSERTPPKQFICPLCSEMFRDAVLVSCCGSTYCNDCIMGHVFDAQILGSHKCPNCEAVLTDHESSVFENALVRSMIRDWLANETIPEPEVGTHQDLFKLDSVTKTHGSRRVLKPKHGFGNNSKSVESVATSDAAAPVSEQTSTEKKMFPSPALPSTSLKSDSPNSSFPKDSKDIVELATTNTISVVTSNTCTAVVASAPSATILGSGKSVLPTDSCVSNPQIPCISYSASNTIVPSILSSIAGATNPLLNAFYNMRVENVQAPVAAQQVVLPVPFQGPVVGGEWSAGTALSASVPQATSLVDTLLHVNNAYGIVAGQPLSGTIPTALSVPVRDREGPKVLSKEEFYRLKMEMLHSSRRRHRHRSRSRSSGRASRRTTNIESDPSVWRQERHNWDRRYPYRSSGDREPDYSQRHRYDSDERYGVRRDRDRSYYNRHHMDGSTHLDNDNERYYRHERRHRDQFTKRSVEAPISVHRRVRAQYDSRSVSLSPDHGKSVGRACDDRDSGTSRGQFESQSLSPCGVSIVPEYDVSESESTESKGMSSQKEFTDLMRPRLDKPRDSPVGFSADNCDLHSALNHPNFEDSVQKIENHYDENIAEQIQKKKKKEKKHKKHKHKHRSEKKKSKKSAESELLKPESDWLTNELSVNSLGDNMADLIGELNRRSKKHKKHKHGSRDKKERKHKTNMSADDAPLPV